MAVIRHLRSFERSLERLGCDYVDLYLIHYPFPEQDRYVETWKALAIREPAIRELASRHNRTPTQIVLRWHLQLGNVAIPGSVTPERLEENFRIFDFELSEEDMRSPDDLDAGHLDRDPSTYAEHDVLSGVVGAMMDFAERHPNIDSLLIQNAMRAVSLVRSRTS